MDKKLLVDPVDVQKLPQRKLPLDAQAFRVDSLVLVAQLISQLLGIRVGPQKPIDTQGLKIGGHGIDREAGMNRAAVKYQVGLLEAPVPRIGIGSKLSWLGNRKQKFALWNDIGHGLEVGKLRVDFGTIRPLEVHEAG